MRVIVCRMDGASTNQPTYESLYNPTKKDGQTNLHSHLSIQLNHTNNTPADALSHVLSVEGLSGHSDEERVALAVDDHALGVPAEVDEGEACFVLCVGTDCCDRSGFGKKAETCGVGCVLCTCVDEQAYLTAFLSTHPNKQTSIHVPAAFLMA